MNTLNNPLISGGLVLGGLTTVFYLLKSFFAKILQRWKAKFVFNVVINDYDELFYVLENWLNKNHSVKLRSLEACYKFEKNSKTYNYSNDSNSDIKKSKKVYYKSEPSIFIINYKGKKIVISKDKKDLTGALEAINQSTFSYRLSVWRNRDILHDFLQAVTEEYNKSLISENVSIYSTDWNGWYKVGEKKVKDITSVIINKNVKSFIIDDLNKFKDSKKWYEDISVAYKRGYLLHGPGGTGKTTLAQAMAAYLHKDICILNLASLTNDQALMKAFSSLPDNGLLMIEDIDCAFEGRQPLGKTLITFSCLLNCLDGVIAKDGLITVMTTNHIDKLDPALIRTGRTDVKIEMPFACKEEISEYMSLFYGHKVEIKKDICLGMSSVQETCIRSSNASDAIKEVFALTATKEELVLN